MTTQMGLKLTIDPKSRRVLLAEAGKDVVDFIFSLLCMPMASIVKLLTKEHMVGSIGSIYKTIESMAETQLVCSQAKSLILSPTFVSPSNFLTGSSSIMSIFGKYYKCSNSSNSSNCSSCFTDMPKSRCPSCPFGMTTELTYVGPNPLRADAETAINTSGFVKGAATYTIMDDLTVMTMSSVASLVALLNKFNIKDVSLLEERTVKLGTKEGLELLEASLKSKTVLTDVFLGMKAEPQLSKGRWTVDDDDDDDDDGI